MAITQQRLKELFDYKEGNLIWKIKPSQPVEIGDIAGCFDNGYLRTIICGKPYLNHRLVYLYFHGYFPENFVDHIDRNTLNNKIDKADIDRTLHPYGYGASLTLFNDILKTMGIETKYLKEEKGPNEKIK